ncbi:MAG: Eco57I restriction-modification methylase domain-containing protein [Candidatus Hermodarchaeota archaeon]
MDRKEIKEQIQVLISKINNLRTKKMQLNSREPCGRIITPFFEKIGWNIQFIDYLNEIEAQAFYLLFKKQNHILLIEKELDADLSKSYNIQGRNISIEKYIINFAWHQNLKWALLTNGVELRAYYTFTDLSNAKFLTLNIEDLANHLEELWLFSTESLVKKKLEPYEKRQTRKDLAQDLFETFFVIYKKLLQDIDLNNQSLSDQELRDSTQRFLNRLLFLRVCEDRETIQTNTLWRLLVNWNSKLSDVNSKPFVFDLRQFFEEFNNQYTVQIFEQHRCDSLVLGNTVLEEVLHLLYRYNFKWLNTDVLGEIYEKYLDSVLHQPQMRLIRSERRKFRKKKGIYYTPPPIVEYMILATLGTELEKIWKETHTFFKKGNSIQAEKVFRQIENIRIVDPACGAGFFLLKALGEFEKYYEKYNKVSKEPIRDYKERILYNNIYGVDIDSQATEIAVMNLLLNVAKRGKALPKIHDMTIKIGNSLLWKSSLKEKTKIQRLAELRTSLTGFIHKIDSERREKEIKTIYEELQRFSQKTLESYIEKPQNYQSFDWEIEFPEVFLEGGFDIVLANPPYVENRQLDRSLKKFYVENFQATMGRFSLFVPFLELAINILKPDKSMAFVLHRNIIRSEIYRKIRKLILDTCRIVSIVDLGSGHFKDVTGEMIVLVMQKEKNPQKRKKNDVEIIFDVENLLSKNYCTKRIPQGFFYDLPFNIFNIALTEGKKRVLDKIEEGSVPLGKILDTRQGIIVGNEKEWVVKNPTNSKYKKVLRGKNIDRYAINFNNNYVFYDHSMLVAAREERIFLEKEKILTQHVSSELKACLDTEQYYALQTINLIIKRKEYPNTDLGYIVGILNSELMNFYYETMFNMGAKFTTAISIRNLDTLPIKFGTEKLRNEVSKLVMQIQAIRKLKNKSELEKQIALLQKKIDVRIFEIYNIESSLLNQLVDN